MKKKINIICTMLVLLFVACSFDCLYAFEISKKDGIYLIGPRISTPDEEELYQDILQFTDNYYRPVFIIKNKRFLDPYSVNGNNLLNLFYKTKGEKFYKMVNIESCKGLRDIFFYNEKDGYKYQAVPKEGVEYLKKTDEYDVIIGEFDSIFPLTKQENKIKKSVNENCEILFNKFETQIKEFLDNTIKKFPQILSNKRYTPAFYIRPQKNGLICTFSFCYQRGANNVYGSEIVFSIFDDGKKAQVFFERKSIDDDIRYHSPVACLDLNNDGQNEVILLIESFNRIGKNRYSIFKVFSYKNNKWENIFTTNSFGCY